VNNVENSDQEHFKIVETRITEVTVYSEQARVTRRGKIALTGKEKELRIAAIPITLKPDSVIAKGSGTMPVRLLGISTEKVLSRQSIENKVNHFLRKIQQVEEQKRSAEDEIKLRTLQLKFIENLGQNPINFLSHKGAEASFLLKEVSDLFNFIGENYKYVQRAIAQSEKQQEQTAKQLSHLEQQLQQLEKASTSESFTIIVLIETNEIGEFEIEISYLVEQASWTPCYDFQVNINKKIVHLNYLASVSQNTGEDWHNVALTLSTAKPAIGTLLPQLNSWYIDLLKIPIMPKVMTHENSSLEYREKELDILGEFEVLTGNTERPPVPVTSQSFTSRVSKESGIVTFALAGNTNIPNEKNPQNISICKKDYPCDFEYIIIPRLVSFSYLQVLLNNPVNGVHLLPGKVNIFRNTTFGGITEIAQVLPGEDFKVNLGIDEGLKIQRDLVERQVEKKSTGNQRIVSYAYRLVITNLRNQEIQLTVMEQLPVSRHEKLKVSVTMTAPKIQPNEMGLLKWSLTLSPKEKQDLYYQFVVENPPDLTVIGLDI
jgi:uncharacterized protein (TIGR02231 family)